MIQELFPDAKNVGLLYCSAEPNSVYQVDDVIEGYLTEHGLHLSPRYAFTDTNDVASVDPERLPTAPTSSTSPPTTPPPPTPRPSPTSCCPRSVPVDRR